MRAKAASAFFHRQRVSVLVLLVLASCMVATLSLLGGCASSVDNPKPETPAESNADTPATGPETSNDTPSAVATGDDSDPYDFGSQSPIPSSNLISADDFQAAADDGTTRIIDVRVPAMASAMMFPWAFSNIPVNQLSLREREFMDEPALIIAGDDNEEAAKAFHALEELGYPTDQIKVLDGGMTGWILDLREIEIHTPISGC